MFKTSVWASQVQLELNTLINTSVMLRVWPRVCVKNPGFISGGQCRTRRLCKPRSTRGAGSGRFWVLLALTHSYTHAHPENTWGLIYASMWITLTKVLTCLKKKRKAVQNRETSLHRFAWGCQDQWEAGGGKGENGVNSTWNRRSFQVTALNFLPWVWEVNRLLMLH